MPNGDEGRPDFRIWIDKCTDPGWGLMPLTHVTKSISAQDIVREGQIDLEECPTLKREVAFLFYGRPSYRTKGDGPIKRPEACPFCFIFTPKLIEQSVAIHAFDTGAFGQRMYKHVLIEEINLEDYSLNNDKNRPNKLINAVFGSQQSYYDGDTSHIPAINDEIPLSEFLVNAYIDLLKSPGRNEPDDRICTIEVATGSPVKLSGQLIAVIVPDVLWDDKHKTPWLMDLAKSDVTVRPFKFRLGKLPEYHHAMIEAEVRKLYIELGYIT